MTKHKHTPGPWTAKLYERQHVIIIKSGEWDEVASIDLAAMPDAESDAALITAAPDLLTACEAFVASCGSAAIACEACAPFKAAIKKARGG